MSCDREGHNDGAQSIAPIACVPALAGSRRKPFHRRCGFSLIELVVVVVLMGILASLASMSVRGVIVRQRLARAIEVVEQFDTALRRSALIQRREVTGVIDRNRHRLVVDSAGDTSITFKLPNQVNIDGVRFAASHGSSPANRFVVGSQGTSSSYALRLVSGTTERWVLFVGGTGQIIHDVDRDSVNALLGAK